MTDKPQFDGKKVKVKLADVCTLTMGQSPSSNSYNEIGNGIPFFQGNADFGEEAPVPRFGGMLHLLNSLSGIMHASFFSVADTD